MKLTLLLLITFLLITFSCKEKVQSPDAYALTFVGVVDADVVVYMILRDQGNVRLLPWT